MKKTLVLAAVALTSLLTASAQSNVYSLNIVGYVNRPIQGNNQFSLIANPLNSPTNTYDGLLKAALPSTWAVLKWTGAGFSSVSRLGGGWLPAAAGTNVIAPGQAVFIKAPAAAAAVTNTFVGEVMVGSFTNSIAAGFQLIGNVIADGGSVTNLNMFPPSGMTLLKWKEDGVGGYTSFSRIGATSWLPSVPSIDVGQGFFVNGTTPWQWVRTFNP